ncbi:MAG TPA: hypothetical protein VE129_15495 [Thermoanaerobaculia bacterium]|nr:hypothetical protein [Thermoanaerobaculia bacterium]
MKAAAAVTAGTLVLLDRELKPDTKKRLTLGKALAGLDPDVRFDVYRNEAGQIVLDPRVSIPAREAWLFRNPEALAAVRRGLDEAAQGKTRPLGSFARHARAR